VPSRCVLHFRRFFSAATSNTPWGWQCHGCIRHLMFFTFLRVSACVVLFLGYPSCWLGQSSREWFLEAGEQIEMESRFLAFHGLLDQWAGSNTAIEGTC